jgi:hypothetical protein
MSNKLCGTMLLRMPPEQAQRLIQRSLELDRQPRLQASSTESNAPESTITEPEISPPCLTEVDM